MARTEGDEVGLEWQGDIGIITLSLDPEKVAILNEARLNSLSQKIDEVANRASCKGLVICGASTRGFCLGADISAIESVTDAKLGSQLAREGQIIFGKIAALPCTTVAAWAGPCVGGGCELVLSCDYRVALNTNSTKIGLPEIKLGILPGFGGSQRLPRLIGLPAALDIILAGKVIDVKRAKKKGLVDCLVQTEEDESKDLTALVKAAKDIIQGESSVQRASLSMVDRFLTFTSIGRSFVYKKAKANVMSLTKGHYPAPLKALDVAVDGLGLPLEQALEQEADALGELIVTSESKSLVYLYFLTERAKKLGRSVSENVENAKVGVIGGGLMGAGIASSILSKGHPVTVVELSEEARQKAREHIEGYISKRRSLSEEEKTQRISMLAIEQDVSEIGGCDLVVEAIVEDLSVKKKVFSKAQEVLGATPILASNTSSLPITQIADGMPHPESIIGMHFFNPAEKMPLVEIIRGKETSERAIVTTAALVARLGKFPVVVDDVPGFLVNRILSPYIAEAGSLLIEGVPVEVIDSAATSFGMPMGPIRLLDEVGLDVAHKVQHIMQEHYGRRMQAPNFLQSLLDDKRLGRKNGRGFYLYEGKEERLDTGLYKMLSVASQPAASIDRQEVCDRLIFALVNEAVSCLEEGVAGAPGAEAAGQIDLATVMGIGFSPFRGGVIRFAQEQGAAAVRGRLEQLAQINPDRFTPHAGIVRRAQNGSSFYDS
jgi:3-hydroxyacyl-CoA dehydrogenase/enoyl-CoA hydratase/3-hydroxybutyryl-CoA epimerase